MGHHYLPQYYLKGFSDQGRIWVHDRKANRSFQTIPKSVANETEMYPDGIEQFLEQEVERPAQEAIARIWDQLPLTEAHREAIATYVVFLWRRVPRARTRVQDHVPQVAEEVKKEILAEIDAIAASDPSVSDLAAQRRAQVEQILERIKTSRSPELWQKGLRTHNSKALIAALLGMNWRFICSEQDEFMTCDNPVFYFESIGIGHPLSEMTIPFSSRVAMWASRRPNFSGEYVSCHPTVVKEINRRTAHSASRFVFTKSNKPWMLPFVMKGRYQLAVLPEVVK